jgi:branched-chain amino acid transport system permease protein
VSEAAAPVRPPVPSRQIRLREARARLAAYVGKAILVVLVGVILGWLGFKASQNVPIFWTVSLNGITLGALYFIIASGFTLIFGLMRVVNMAHGVLYLLGGWVGFHVLQSTGEWGLGLLAATGIAAGVGLVMQQLFLRWNQGQDLRQAMITIAISVIIADQILSWYGGTARSIAWPDVLDKSSPLHFYGLSYPFVRFFLLFCAIAIGLGIWLWLRKTRMGMVVRAGVDDRPMVSALGVNIQLIFALVFTVGSGLAGFSGMLGGSLISVGPGEDVNFLINSLIVVIIGGMGSLGGAAIGALLLGLVDSYADVYLVFGGHNYTNYSVLVTFLLLVIVLAVRPLGLFGRPA